MFFAFIYYICYNSQNIIKIIIMAETLKHNENSISQNQWEIDLYSPEITQRVINLIKKTDIPDIIKQHYIENIDKYDRAQLIRILGKYFERLKEINETDRKNKLEMEEAQRRFLDDLELEKKSQNIVW